jgi:hypothetical protein
LEPNNCNFHLRAWDGTRLESLCSLFQQHHPIPPEITLSEFHFLAYKCNLVFFHQNFKCAMKLFEWNYNIYSCFSTKSQGDCANIILLFTTSECTSPRLSDISKNLVLPSKNTPVQLHQFVLFLFDDGEKR